MRRTLTNTAVSMTSLALSISTLQPSTSVNRRERSCHALRSAWRLTGYCVSTFSTTICLQTSKKQRQRRHDMLIGYARVSTSRQGQSLDTQREALIDAGCDPNHIYADTISGTKWQRPGLDDALAYMRPDDTLVVTRLDRLGRSLAETVNTIADLAERDINVKVLEPALDTSRP